MDLVIDFNGSTFTCAICGKDGIVCSTKHELWHHHDFFQFATYLHACVPWIECPCCGIKIVDRPWAREGSQFKLVQAESPTE